MKRSDIIKELKDIEERIQKIRVAGTQNITLTCISKGVLEKELLKKIIRK